MFREYLLKTYNITDRQLAKVESGILKGYTLKRMYTIRTVRNVRGRGIFQTSSLRSQAPGRCMSMAIRRMRSGASTSIMKMRARTKLSLMMNTSKTIWKTIRMIIQMSIKEV